MAPDEFERLAAFLVVAKCRTYAGEDDDATISAPLLPGSRQLEHADGDYHYRDVYFGLAHFVGQEVVTVRGVPVWAMSYSGGIRPQAAGLAPAREVYAFLRAALLRVDTAAPYRGPASFAAGEYRYTNAAEGDLMRFHGVERIHRGATELYELRYSGGILS